MGGWTWRGRRCRLREPRVLRRSGQRPATDSGDSIIYAAACHSKWAVRRQCPFTVSVLGRQASTRQVAQQLAEKKPPILMFDLLQVLGGRGAAAESHGTGNQRKKAGVGHAVA